MMGSESEHKKGYGKKIILLFSVLCSLYSVCYAGSLSSTDLINSAKEYDGRVVTYEGEVIGDIMMRGEYAWINVNDNVNAIGIWMPKELAKNIAYKGTYNIKGDVIEVTGAFHRSCKQHGGDLDIHAESMVKLKDGYSIPEAMDLTKARYAIIFGIILVIVLFWKVYRRLL